MDLIKQWPYEETEGAFLSTSPQSLLIFFIITILFLFKLTRKTTPISLNLPPSPPKLPLIGNLHQLGILPHISLRTLSKKYGDMITLQLGQQQTKTIVISSAEIAKEINKTNDLAFSNRPQNTAAKILLYGCNDIGFNLYCEDWKRKRKLCVLQLLSAKRVQSFSAIREEVVIDLVNDLRGASSHGESVDLSEILISTTNNVVCKCALGKKYDREGGMQELARKVMIHLTAFTVRDYFPMLGWIDVVLRKIKKYKDTFAELDALFDKVIEEHKAKKEDDDGGDRMDFVDIILQLQKDGQIDFEFTNNDLKAILMDMFVGGTDTSATTLEWAMTRLMKNPKIMKKAQEEVRRVVGRKSKVEENDINQMHYLKYIVKETLRLHPPCTILPPRETIYNVKLKEYHIPEKTMILINLWAIQRDPELWENSEKFMPERFEKSQVDFIGQDFQFIPFGFGRRGCPGMIFGIAMVEYVLANLLCWFDWELPENLSSIEDMDMGEVYGLVVSRKVPLRLKPIAFSY